MHLGKKVEGPKKFSLRKHGAVKTVCAVLRKLYTSDIVCESAVFCGSRTYIQVLPVTVNTVVDLKSLSVAKLNAWISQLQSTMRSCNFQNTQK